jgi:hypothetical protein
MLKNIADNTSVGSELTYLTRNGDLYIGESIVARDVSNFFMANPAVMVLTKKDGSLVSYPGNDLVIAPGNHKIMFECVSNYDSVLNLRG